MEAHPRNYCQAPRARLRRAGKVPKEGRQSGAFFYFAQMIGSRGSGWEASEELMSVATRANPSS